MFSTSITASSTTTPSATTRPPSVIVLRLSPKSSSIQTVVSRVSGIALNDTKAPRQSRKVSEQQRDDEHRADQQRIAQLRDRALDEARRPQQRGVIRRRPARQCRRERVEALLERARDLERVRAELRRRLDQNAGTSRRSTRRRSAARRRPDATRRRRAAPARSRACPGGPAPARERGARRLRLDARCAATRSRR